MTVYVVARDPKEAQKCIDRFATKPKAWTIIRTPADLPPKTEKGAVFVCYGEWYWKHPYHSSIFSSYMTEIQAQVIYSAELE